MDNNINFDCDNLKIKVSNSHIGCYGAIGLFDFDYHFDLEIEDIDSHTIIKQKFSGDISELIDFCKRNSILKSSQTDCSLDIDTDYSKPLKNHESFIVLKFQTSNMNYTKNIGYCKENVDNFKLELKSLFEYLVEQYIKENPDKNCKITKVKF